MVEQVKMADISIYQVNLGYRVQSQELFMHWLANSTKKWIICLQEPYIGKSGVTNLPKSYGCFWSERNLAESKRLRAMIIMHKDYNGYQLTQHSNTDAVYIQLEDFNVCIASIYCAMDGNIQTVMDGIKRVREGRKRIIACLDANAYHHDWGASVRAVRDNPRQRVRGEIMTENLFEAKMCVCNIVPHKPTFMRHIGEERKGASHIDVTICTEEILENIQEWEVRSTEFDNDHNVIVFRYVTGVRKGKQDCELVAERGTGTPWKNPTSKMRRVMYEQLGENVRYKARIANTGDVDNFMNIHVSEVRRTLDGIFMRKEKGKEGNVYWWTEKVGQAHEELKKARRRLKRYKHRDLRIEYNRSRGNFRRETIRAKREAWMSFVSNIRSPWEGLMKIVRASGRGKIQSRTLSDLEGNFAENMKSSLKLMSTQFYPPLEPLNEQHEEVEEEVQRKLGGDYERGKDFTTHELKHALAQLSAGTAPGLDKITNNVLGFLASTRFENAYLQVYNTCLKWAYFPAEWKKARIALIPKQSSEVDTAKAFRPISLTSVFAKLFERMILQRLMHYLCKSGRMTENQHAYQRGKSTQTALFELFEVVQGAINKKGGGICVVVFLDISGAFDRTWHAGILSRLIEYGIPLYLVAIIRAYLTNRSAHFSESGAQHVATLEQGCPQGGVISPVLWNILFNSLLEMKVDQGSSRGNVVKVIGYADDAAIVCRAKTVEEASTILNVHLNKVYDWSVKNRVKFNAAKLAAMVISNRQASPPPAEVRFNGVLVTEVSHYKYLGLVVDNKLNWQAQIKNVINRLEMVTNSLRALSGQEWGLKLKIFRVLFKAIFYPIMTYGIGIWGWKAVQRKVCEKFDKQIRKFGILATRCLKSTSSVYIRSLLNTTEFEQILHTEVLAVSVRQFRVTHTLRQSVYDSYSKTIKKKEYPQSMDHFHTMCRRRVECEYEDLEFEDSSDIYDTHPALWRTNECIIQNSVCALTDGNTQSGWNIYTDASACSYGKGWGYVVYHHGFKVATNHGSIANCDVYRAELHAILQATIFVRGSSEIVRKEIVEIRTDCQAAVRALQSYVQNDKEVRKINETLRDIGEEGKRVIIRWIPGHSGINGNMAADTLAKRAVDSAVTERMRTDKRVMTNLVKTVRKEKLEEEWGKMKARGIHMFLPTMRDVHRFVESQPNAALCQLVSGHTRLNDFICKKWKLIPYSRCACGEADETVSHFLFDCELYEHVRQNIWTDFQPEYEFIARDWSKLRMYVNQSGRFKGGWF